MSNTRLVRILVPALLTAAFAVALPHPTHGQATVNSTTTILPSGIGFEDSADLRWGNLDVSQVTTVVPDPNAFSDGGDRSPARWITERVQGLYTCYNVRFALPSSLKREGGGGELSVTWGDQAAFAESYGQHSTGQSVTFDPAVGASVRMGTSGDPSSSCLDANLGRQAAIYLGGTVDGGDAPAGIYSADVTLSISPDS